MSLNTLTRLICHCLFNRGYLFLCFLLQRVHIHSLMDFRVFLCLLSRIKVKVTETYCKIHLYTYKIFQWCFKGKKTQPTNLTPFEKQFPSWIPVFICFSSQTHSLLTMTAFSICCVLQLQVAVKVLLMLSMTVSFFC